MDYGGKHYLEYVCMYHILETYCIIFILRSVNSVRSVNSDMLSHFGNTIHYIRSMLLLNFLVRINFVFLFTEKTLERIVSSWVVRSCHIWTLPGRSSRTHVTWFSYSWVCLSWLTLSVLSPGYISKGNTTYC